MAKAEGYCIGCQALTILTDGEYCTPECRKIYEENPPFNV